MFHSLSLVTRPYLGTPPLRSRSCTSCSSALPRTAARPFARLESGPPIGWSSPRAEPRTASDPRAWPSRRTCGEVCRESGTHITSHSLGLVRLYLRHRTSVLIIVIIIKSNSLLHHHRADDGQSVGESVYIPSLDTRAYCLKHTQETPFFYADLLSCNKSLQSLRGGREKIRAVGIDY